MGLVAILDVYTLENVHLAVLGSRKGCGGGGFFGVVVLKAGLVTSLLLLEGPCGVLF